MSDTILQAYISQELMDYNNYDNYGNPKYKTIRVPRDINFTGKWKITEKYSGEEPVLAFEIFFLEDLANIKQYYTMVITKFEEPMFFIRLWHKISRTEKNKENGYIEREIKKVFYDPPHKPVCYWVNECDIVEVHNYECGENIENIV